jgi:hypothetical protein
MSIKKQFFQITLFDFQRSGILTIFKNHFDIMKLILIFVHHLTKNILQIMDIP